EIIRRLRKRGVDTTVNYRPVHLLSFFRRQARWRKARFPVAEALGERLLSLPFYPRLQKAEADHVIHSLRRILAELASSGR
ncbi:DegT/DnrJ/EryC1/StrS aminotransferase family protein, partial [bacterium]|nr:DegT/DnrJ/EryC1/StrS aminotransferase family protein [bacterium]